MYTLGEVQVLIATSIKETRANAIHHFYGGSEADVVAGLLHHAEQVAELERVTLSVLLDALAETVAEMDEEQTEEGTLILDDPDYDDDQNQPTREALSKALDYAKEGLPPAMFDARGNRRGGQAESTR